MSISILRRFVCWTLLVFVPASLLGQTTQGQETPAPTGQAQAEPGQAQSPAAQIPPNQGHLPEAILHTQGGVWINGYEATDSSALFDGDLIETKTGFTANLSLEGTTIQIQPESVGKLQDNFLALDHGSVSVGTSKSFQVRVKCITVVPVLTQWTQYDVTDVNGNVQVVAHKSDVNVQHEGGRRDTAQTDANSSKVPPATDNSRDSDRGIVHETETKNYQESDLCGAAASPTSPGNMLNPKWIGAGAAGVGVLVWVLIHGGGGKTPISASQP